MLGAFSRRRRLVGQPLLYAISIFASLGVFLVRPGFYSTEHTL